MNPAFPERELGGWGRFPTARTRVTRPEQMAALAELVTAQPGLIARGLGRSYGDAAVAPSGVTLMTERLNRFLAFDADTGVVRCESGRHHRRPAAPLAAAGLLPAGDAGDQVRQPWVAPSPATCTARVTTRTAPFPGTCPSSPC
jgi:FAD/FMN-containing dehydrogenase